jgi:hypothetical protein
METVLEQKESGNGMAACRVVVPGWRVFDECRAARRQRRARRTLSKSVRQAAALGLGMLASGLFAARHFGRFHGGRVTGRP